MQVNEDLKEENSAFDTNLCMHDSPLEIVSEFLESHNFSWNSHVIAWQNVWANFASMLGPI